MMARAITGSELTLLRSDSQHSLLSLFVHKPTAVFSATVGTPPVSNDKVSQVNYTLTGGSAAAVIDGMTCLIGTAAGGYDIGIIRARGAAAGVLSIGTCSDIAWATGQHITVLADWNIWARMIAYNDGLWNIEGEAAYSDQHTNCLPVPVLGPTVAVLPYNGSPVVFSPSAAGSWVPGSTITGYAWSAVGASVTANMDTASPTITYYGPGVYQVTCTVTAANGQSATGYRVVYVPGAGALPAVNFSVEKVYGELQGGGWQFEVTMYDPTELSGIRPQALVVLYARDIYGSTEQSIGPLAGYENVIAIGWIDGSTINWHPEQGAVQFTVKGPAAWMQKISAWPVSLIDVTGTPTDWMSMQALTVDKGLWHLMTWRSTASKVIDIIPSGDTRRSFDCSGNLGSLWDQLKAFGVKIGADPACDRYGRLHLATDIQVTPLASRSSVPVVMDLTKSDWQDQINITRRGYKVTSLLEVAGFNYNGGNWGAIVARSPGNAMYNTGAMGSRYNWIFNDQSQANEIAGLLLAQQNNEFPTIDFVMAANNRMIDITPPQFLTVTMASGDNPLGLTWTGKRIIPRRVELNFDQDNGIVTTQIEAEGETGQVHAITVIYPTVPIENIPTIPLFPGLNSFPIVPISFGTPEPFLPPQPGVDPDSTCYTDTAAPANGPYDLAVYGARDSMHPVSRDYHFYLRSSAHTNLTRYEIRGRFQKRVNGVWQDTAEDGFYIVQAHIHYTGDYIAGIKDAVTNPNVRTGVLPGGLSSQDIDAITVTIANSFTFNPNEVTFEASSENDAWVTLKTGSQVWWKKGSGACATWTGFKGYTTGAVYSARLTHKVVFNNPAGESWQGKFFLVNVKATPADATILSSEISIGGGLSWRQLTAARQYYGEEQNSSLIHNLGLRAGGYLARNTQFDFTLNVEVYPVSDYRILFGGMYLYNICPPIA